MRHLIFVVLVAAFQAAHAQEYPYTWVFLSSREDKAELPQEEVDKLMKGHLANIDRLVKEGKLLVAGPFEGGGGVFIFNSPSVKEVNEWLSTDPAVQAGRWHIETLPYASQIGGVCLAQPPYEMVTYQFIRFKSVITKFSVHHADTSFEKHRNFVDELARTGNVITSGIFANQDGAILVIRGDVQYEVIDADPAVKDGLLRPVFKKLWVARGSFCEK